jgi:tRNA modification GTPase
MRRTLEEIADADFALVVLDGSEALNEDDRQVIAHVANVPHLVVVNKNDLPEAIDLNILNGASRLSVSAKTGKGVDELRTALSAFLLSQNRI